MPAIPSPLPSLSHLQKRASSTPIPLWLPIILGVVIVLLLIALLTLYHLFRRQLARIALKSTTSDAAVYKCSTDGPLANDEDERVTPHPRDAEAPPNGVPYFFFEDILMMDQVDHVNSGGFAMVAKGRFVGTAAQQVGYQCE